MYEPLFLGFLWGAVFGFLFGIAFGQWTEATRWRRKGNNMILNRMSSGGKLYIVKQEAKTND